MEPGKSADDVATQPGVYDKNKTFVHIGQGISNHQSPWESTELID
jgi:hypothetical protein